VNEGVPDKLCKDEFNSWIQFIMPILGSACLFLGIVLSLGIYGCYIIIKNPLPISDQDDEFEGSQPYEKVKEVDGPEEPSPEK
jgi:hypothetical protein